MSDLTFELSHDQQTWHPAVIPGGVHESLMAAGVIEHPYFGDNEAAVRWIEDETWWYRARLSTPPAKEGDRVVLVLPAADTVVDVSIDGTQVGSSANAFVPVEIDVTAMPRDDAELLVRVRPPLADLEPAASTVRTSQLFRENRERQRRESGVAEVEEPAPTSGPSAVLALTRRRKPTFSWGWDFGPRVPSVGLLAQPYVRRDRYAVPHWHVRTLSVDVERAVAQVAIDVDVEAFGTSEDLTGRVVLTSPAGSSTVVELPLPAGVGSTRRATAVVTVHDAQLWWTHDLGAAALYGVQAELQLAGETVSTSRFRVGLRTVTLDRSVDREQPGRLFRFLLNGVPTFSRGANWVPASTLLGSVTPERVRRLIETARRGEMTMLRIWGGGLYEQDAFYDACDELGLLVWQDFMFACLDYPSEDRVLQQEVAQEAEFQVRRLRNHASLAVWAGNNEVHGLHRAAHGNVDPGDWGWHFFHGVLPDAVSRHSPGAIYWPGSPWSDDDPYGINGVHDGDRHAWEVWHGVEMGAGGPTEFASRGEQVHWSRYGYDKGRFISEFGIHASPEERTLLRWTPPGSLALRSEAFDGRNKDQPKDKGWALMEHETGVPTTLTEYVDYSMACQAEGLKYGVEHYRRRQPHTNGTLVWQFNDVWPGFSWSVVDHDLVPKHGYYALQRAYRPLLASFRIDGDRLELWLTNSGRDAGELTLLVELQTLSGAPLLAEKVSAPAPAYSSAVVWTGAVPSQRDAYAWVSSPDGAIEANRLFFAPLKELSFNGSLSTKVLSTSATSAEVELVASGFCYAARALSPAPGVVFDANYLDLRDGDRRTIAVSGLPAGFDLADLEARTFSEGRP
jgi:beta-mannosidase